MPSEIGEVVERRVEAGAPAQTRGGRSAQSSPDRIARRTERCAVKQPPPADLAAIEEALATRGGTDNNQFVTIPVYWHIITTTKGDGDVSGLVPAQMQVLNQAYAGSNFAFEVQSVQVIKNNAWYFSAIESAEEQQMKNTLRRGGPEALNIYTTNGDVYLGWATPGFYYKFFPKYDGVVLWWATLPGTGLSGAADEEHDDRGLRLLRLERAKTPRALQSHQLAGYREAQLLRGVVNGGRSAGGLLRSAPKGYPRQAQGREAAADEPAFAVDDLELRRPAMPGTTNQ